MIGKGTCSQTVDTSSLQDKRCSAHPSFRRCSARQYHSGRSRTLQDGSTESVQDGARKRRQPEGNRKKIQPATVNRELACLRLIFNHDIKAKVSVENPVSKNGAKTLQEANEHTRVLIYEE
jgi:hypothetical protein